MSSRKECVFVDYYQLIEKRKFASKVQVYIDLDITSAQRRELNPTLIRHWRHQWYHFRYQWSPVDLFLSLLNQKLYCPNLSVDQIYQKGQRQWTANRHILFHRLVKVFFPHTKFLPLPLLCSAVSLAVLSSQSHFQSPAWHLTSSSPLWPCRGHMGMDCAPWPCRRMMTWLKGGSSLNKTHQGVRYQRDVDERDWRKACCLQASCIHHYQKLHLSSQWPVSIHHTQASARGKKTRKMKFIFSLGDHTGPPCQEVLKVLRAQTSCRLREHCLLFFVSFPAGEKKEGICCHRVDSPHSERVRRSAKWLLMVCRKHQAQANMP